MSHPDANQPTYTLQAPVPVRRVLLIVDDDPVVRRAIRRAMRRLPDRPIILEADTLAAARAALARHPVSTIVLDIELPDGEGTELVESLSGPDRPAIVVLTGLDESSIGPRLIEAGVEDVIQKSRVTPASLTRAIAFAQQRHLNRRSRPSAAPHLEQFKRLPIIGLASGEACGELIRETSGTISGVPVWRGGRAGGPRRLAARLEALERRPPAHAFLPITAHALSSSESRAHLIAAAQGLGSREMTLLIRPADSPLDARRLANDIAPLRDAGIRIGVADVGGGHVPLAALLRLRPVVLQAAQELIYSALGTPTGEPLASLVGVANALNSQVLITHLRGPADTRRAATWGVHLGAFRTSAQ